MIHNPRKPAIGATGNSVRLVQKSPRTSRFAGKDWGCAGKTAHREHRIGHPRSEKPSGSAVRSVKTANEVEYTASFQTDGRQGDDGNTLQILDRLLIDLFGRDEQRHVASALREFFGDGHPREQMATRSATGNRDRPGS